MDQKIKFELLVKCEGYSEFRLREIIQWILGPSNKVPLDAKTKIRVFYDYFTDFMKYDAIDTKYGIRYWFEEDEIHFQREAGKVLWGKVYEKKVL